MYIGNNVTIFSILNADLKYVYVSNLLLVLKSEAYNIVTEIILSYYVYVTGNMNNLGIMYNVLGIIYNAVRL